MRKKILLSTDIGSDIDDALSLLAMLNHPEIDLAGIYTVNGNVAARSCIAKQMINLAGRDIPVAKGEAEPLGKWGSRVEPYHFLEEDLVDDAFFDQDRMEKRGRYFRPAYRPFSEVGIISRGIEHLADQLSQEKFTVFSIAPLTNLTRVLWNYPEAARNIEHLYIMGARFPAGEMEHNFRHDALAAKEILVSEIPLTIVPGSLCERYRLPAEEGESTRESKVGKYVHMMLKAFVGAKLVERYNNRVVQGRELSKVLEDVVRIDIKLATARGIDQEDCFRLERFKNDFLTNFDYSAACFEGEKFWKDFYQLVAQLKDPKNCYRLGNLIAAELESLVPRDISIADVYVPYCFLHPERLVTERMTVDCDEKGKTWVRKGAKHEVVKDLDFVHFKEFLGKYLK